jgi:hypothetical protein
MRNNFKSRSLRGSIAGLFSHKATTDMHKLHPDAYFARVYLSKTNFEMVEFIAKCFKTSKIRMTNELIERGIRSFYGEVIGKEITDYNDARQRAQKAKVDHFILAFRKLAKSQGYDISKFI